MGFGNDLYQVLHLSRHFWRDPAGPTLAQVNLIIDLTRWAQREVGGDFDHCGHTLDETESEALAELDRRMCGEDTVVPYHVACGGFCAVCDGPLIQDRDLVTRTGWAHLGPVLAHARCVPGVPASLVEPV